MDEFQPNLPLEPLTTAPPPPLPEKKTGFFIGPKGLRAGWRFALFNLLWFVFVSAIAFVLQKLLHPPRNRAFTPIFDISQELLFLVSFVLALAVMFKIERRPFKLDFLPLRGLFGRNFWVGSLWGFCSLTALLLMMRGLNDFSFGPLALHGSELVKFALLWALAFFLVGIFEESFSRGYGLRTLATRMGFWPAAVITSLIFGAIHIGNGGEQWLGIASVVAIAFILCLTLWRTGTLWFAVGLHFGWDYAETFIYGVPDSGEVATGHLLTPHFRGSHWITGGSVGPEGSLLVFVIYGLMALLFHFSYRERKLADSDIPSERRSHEEGSLPAPSQTG